MALLSTGLLAVACKKPIYISTTPMNSLTYSQSVSPALMNEPAMAGIKAPAAIRILPTIRLAKTFLRQKRNAEYKAPPTRVIVP